jgi:hypothetical protein
VIAVGVIAVGGMASSSELGNNVEVCE